MIWNIIYSWFSFFIIGMLAAFCWKEFLYYPDCIHLLSFTQKPGWVPDLFNCFLCILWKDAICIYPGNVLSSFNITCIFEGWNGGFNPCFNFTYIVVPTCFSCNFESWLRSLCPELCYELYRFPDLLYFLYIEFSLIKQNEVFAQIFFIKQYITISSNTFVSACPSCFLYIVFKRIGDFIMNNHSDIFFVNAHSECRSSNHHFYWTWNKCILVFTLLLWIHFAMVGFWKESICSESLSQ